MFYKMDLLMKSVIIVIIVNSCLFTQINGQKTVLPVCENGDMNDDPSMCIIDFVNGKFEELPQIISSSLGGNASEVLQAVARSTTTFTSTVSSLISTTESLQNDLNTEVRSAVDIVASLDEFNNGLASAISAMDNVKTACNDIRANGIPATCTCSGSAGGGNSGSSQILTCDSHLPSDCQELKYLGNTQDGIYTIYPVSLDHGIRVYCDMHTDNEAWIVIQRRRDGSVNFTQNWDTYASGFGDLDGEFWLGNNYLNALTSVRPFSLRIDLRTFEYVSTYALFTFFRVENEANQFRLRVNHYSGTAENHFSEHNGVAFSTIDVDNDNDDERDCALTYKGGWWYNGALSYCNTASLNNPYVPGGTVAEPFSGISYDAYYFGNSIFEFTELKIK